MKVALIVARDKKTKGIGYKNTIPWNDKTDMKWFKDITLGDGENTNVVIMGRKTYESLNGRVLGGRGNIVITHHPESITDNRIFTAPSVEEAIKLAYSYKCDSAFIIGGNTIYKQALDIAESDEHLEVDTIYLTELDAPDNAKFDTYFKYDDIIDSTFTIDKHMSKYYTDRYYFDKNVCNEINVLRRKYSHINETDKSYIKLIWDILDNGKLKDTRAGETASVFGRMLRFDLRQGLPILTTKKVFSKGCIHELLWFLKGDTNIKYLIDNNTHIWDDDAYRYFLQSILPYIPGLEAQSMSKEEFLTHVMNSDTVAYVHPTTKEITMYTYGDLGPIYGKQWVDWNGVNQIENLIHTLKTNPSDRRLLVSAWNVSEIKNMALPPCHYMSQWYTTEISENDRQAYTDGQYYYSTDELDAMGIPKYYLSCMWHQRSVDTCLGFPYDLLSYSVLTTLVASTCNMIPYEVLCTLGDTHIYCNQFDSVYKQLDRNYNKYTLPRLELQKHKNNMNEWNYEDIKIIGYNSYKSVKYKLSVGL